MLARAIPAAATSISTRALEAWIIGRLSSLESHIAEAAKSLIPQVALNPDDILATPRLCHLSAAALGFLLAEAGIPSYSVHRFLPTNTAYPCYEHEFLMTATSEGWVIVDPAARQFFGALGLPVSMYPFDKVLVATDAQLKAMIASFSTWREATPRPLLIDGLWQEPEHIPVVLEQGADFRAYLRRIWMSDYEAAPRAEQKSFMELLRAELHQLPFVTATIRNAVITPSARHVGAFETAPALPPRPIDYGLSLESFIRPSFRHRTSLPATPKLGPDPASPNKRSIKPAAEHPTA